MLSFIHFQPAEKTVNIIDEERQKAHRNRNVGAVIYRGNNPQNNQHDIICCVSKGEIGASPEGKIYRYKACGNRDGAYNKVRRS